MDLTINEKRNKKSKISKSNKIKKILYLDQQ